MATVLLAGVPKSPNLGDGLIARTLTHLIHMHGPHEVIHFDITQGSVEDAEGANHGTATGFASKAGTAAPAAPSLPKLNETGLKKRATPNGLRMLKAYWIHRRKDATVGAKLRSLVAKSDTVFLGGGHLLIDTYLTFPLAVKRVADEARRQRKPLHIVLVGARGPWSAPARAWFRGACRYATTITLRDEESRKFLLEMDPTLAGKTTALSDPALFTREAFESNGEGEDNVDALGNLELSGIWRDAPAVVAAMADASGSRLAPPRRAERSDSRQPGSMVAVPERFKRVVGLGIMDPNELKRASEHRWERETCANWWREAAESLLAQGCEVRVFTNGAATDNGFVETYVKPRCAGLANVSFCPYPATVDDLYRQLAACDAVIAQRLHACLPSASMLKPTYAVVWDKKLTDIFTDLGLAGRLVDFRVPAAETVAAMQLDAAPGGRFTETMGRKKNAISEQVRSMLP